MQLCNCAASPTILPVDCRGTSDPSRLVPNEAHRAAPFCLSSLLCGAMQVDRSIVEVFVMGGRVVFSKVYAPALLYVPDTHVALRAWGAPTTADVEVHSMGCGWTAEPYQAHPTEKSI
eukprot:SAG22_NODE_30_length_28348_cov_12.488584_25_plen_118_part_00